jgi:polyhydroxyalkanoate synthesis repressor PhaR
MYKGSERFIAMKDVLLLKKYSNRRLYDTEKSAYVTLDHVMQVIRRGRPVAVVDAKSGEDVTAFILTQIILEESRKRNSLLPVPLLHLIIRHGENILSEFFQKYLEQTIKNYLSYKAAADDQFKKWLHLGMDLSSLTKQSIATLPAFQSFFDSVRDPDSSPIKDNK